MLMTIYLHTMSMKPENISGSGDQVSALSFSQKIERELEEVQLNPQSL